jgi:hypothetical protein
LALVFYDLELLMNKLLSSLALVALAMSSGAAFAGSHAGAPMGDKKMEELKAACKKADPKMDDKMKAECKALEAKK